MQPTPATAPEHSESELLQFRREKLDGLVKAGVNAFGGRFDTTHQPGLLKANFEENLTVSVAGRILSRREMGKATFFDLGDISGRMQCYLSKGDVGDEAYVQFNQLVDIAEGIAGIKLNRRYKLDAPRGVAGGGGGGVGEGAGGVVEGDGALGGAGGCGAWPGVVPGAHGGRNCVHHGRGRGGGAASSSLRGLERRCFGLAGRN